MNRDIRGGPTRRDFLRQTGRAGLVLSAGGLAGLFVDEIVVE